MSLMRCLLLLFLVVPLLSACSIIREDIDELGPTLADLKPVVLPPDPPDVPKASLDEVEANYRAALEVAEDPNTKRKILVRLADLEMKRSERNQLDSNEDKQFFDKAITYYDDILKDDLSQDPSISEERLLYRLSKAYALDGRMEESDQALTELVAKYPNSLFAAEAEFRRAEHAFSLSDYQSAESYYGNVANFGQQTQFYLNAIYMKGWSQFKRSNYNDAVVSFTLVLDHILEGEKLVADLESSKQNLASDTLRVMGFSFSYMDGPKSITSLYEANGERHYQHLMFIELGQLYLEKKRYRDAADTYQHYIDFYPNGDYGPEFSVQMIEVYNRGNFPSMILPAKEGFINNYGITSNFWQQRSTVGAVEYGDTLKSYLDEVSSYYHARAQQKKKTTLAQGKKITNKIKRELNSDLLTAANYYSEYVASFPDDSKTPGFTFLMAEALYEADQLPKAVAAYEKVAYEYKDEKNGAEAGYAAILTEQKIMEQLRRSKDTDQLAIWQNKEIESSILFADTYPLDRRAAPVLTHSAEILFQQQQFERAIELATRITIWQPEPEIKLQKTAWLVLGHSQYELEQFDSAEVSYRKTLTLMTQQDKDRKAVVDRIAASMFKSSELQVAAGETGLAVDKLLRISAIAPGSEIATNAQYDAGNYLMELQQWERAEKVFLDFRLNNPKHSLAATITPKLVKIYESMERWDKAADSLSEVAKNDKDKEIRRNSLYLAAEYYEKSKKYLPAISSYRSYVHTYPAPFALAVEGRAKLVELYGKLDMQDKRDFWLNQMIKAHARAGKNKTDRSRYFAAMAQTEFAGREYLKFERIKIKQPFKRSIKAKLSALKVVVNSYNKVLEYKVGDFSTQANHKLGEISAQLFYDLMASERPKNLNEMELEEYELMLEEQAYPHKKKAVALLEANASRSWGGFYDDWVKKSFFQLAKLLPARYGKKESRIEVSRGLH